MKKLNQCVKRIGAAVVLSGCLLLTGCGEKSGTEAVKLDKNKPVDITVWHYYNGAQEAAFARMVSEFNDTVGKEQGIYVESHSKGNVTELETAVLAASRKEVGSDAMPNLFSSYADTAYELEKEGALADLAPYFTAEEQAEYLDSYIEEGRIGLNGELKIFPIAKSTEVLMLNKTVWDEFAADTGVTEDSLKTVEGITETAALYYDWTDAKTPDVPNDGKAFYGRDAMANLFIIGSMQRGVELFHVENGKVTLNVDRDVFYEIWQNYYVPFVKGYFGAYGRFRSDDLKIGELAAYTGSIASAGYFPDQTEIGDKITPIECLVMPAPMFEGAEPYIIQQGAGMVVAKGTKEQEYASVVFLKWFTEAERNTEFGCTSGYIPVKKEANNKETLDAVIQDKNLEMSTKEYDTLLTAYDMVASSNLYTNKAFDGGAKARKVLEYGLSDKAAADREQVMQLLEEGKTLEEAAGSFITEDAFNVWFEEIKKELESSVALP
ncbi:MAG: extracellular solute-binding protein [Hungatella hathewayi]|nr:extracellular solute-binding protein [Hungatella hathewayi]